eukprot:TRINITY_DN25403_c0_g1_i1.p2 TRINITY_DN25403_c0_g1~~TRINITY_DN25403_c0_g1_i1.p2  ORF type:complete len:141 (-),score=14.66 TRINITY_DN25403_c0_g1_i1:132-554(-)
MRVQSVEAATQTFIGSKTVVLVGSTISPRDSIYMVQRLWQKMLIKYYSRNLTVLHDGPLIRREHLAFGKSDESGTVKTCIGYAPTVDPQHVIEPSPLLHSTVAPSPTQHCCSCGFAMPLETHRCGGCGWKQKHTQTRRKN